MSKVLTLKSGKSKQSILSRKTSKSNIVSKPNDSKTKISMISSLTDTKVEIKTSEINEKVLEKLVTNYSKENNIKNLDGFCMENNQKDFGFLTGISSTNKQLEEFAFSSPREEGEQCQLIEKNIIDKCREEKDKYIKTVNKLNKEVEEISFKLSKVKGENNFVLQAIAFQDNVKLDNAKQLEHMETLLKECTLQNQMYKNELSTQKILKDNLMNALIFYISKYDSVLCEELKYLVNIYNNQYFKASSKCADEKYIESLFAQIKDYERKIIAKNKEIKDLEKRVVIQDKFRRFNFMNAPKPNNQNQ